MAAIGQIVDDDMVLIEFTPNFRGNRHIIGTAFKDANGKYLKYGYGRRAGERFLVHRLDQQAQPHLFKIVTETQPAATVKEEKVPLSAPTPIVDTGFHLVEFANEVGLTEEQSQGLFMAGFTTEEAILEGDLTKVKGIGKATEKKIKAALNE